MAHSNTVVSANTMYRHLQQYCSHSCTFMYYLEGSIYIHVSKVQFSNKI